jgi:hypothetical protein
MPKTPRFAPNLDRPLPVRPVEVVVFPGVQMLDVTGPLQVFATTNDIVAQLGRTRPYELRVVAKNGRNVTASAGLATEALSPLDMLVLLGCGPGESFGSGAQDVSMINRVSKPTSGQVVSFSVDAIMEMPASWRLGFENFSSVKVVND